jgi:hypothetical protein
MVKYKIVESKKGYRFFLMHGKKIVYKSMIYSNYADCMHDAMYKNSQYL